VDVCDLDLDVADNTGEKRINAGSGSGHLLLRNLLLEGRKGVLEDGVFACGDDGHHVFRRQRASIARAHQDIDVRNANLDRNAIKAGPVGCDRQGANDAVFDNDGKIQERQSVATHTDVF
jgi:hypothetical protein